MNAAMKYGSVRIWTLAKTSAGKKYRCLSSAGRLWRVRTFINSRPTTSLAHGKSRCCTGGDV